MTSTPTATHSIESTTALLQAELPELEQQQVALQTELAAVSDRLESVRAALAALSALSATVVPAPRAAEPPAGAPAAPQAPAEPVADIDMEAFPSESAAEVPTPDERTAEAAVENAAENAVETPDETAGTRSVTGSGTSRTSRRTATAPKSKAKKPAAASRRRPAGKAPTAPGRSVKSKARTQSADSARKTADEVAAAGAAPESGGLTEQVIAVLSRQLGTALRARDVAQALGRDDSAGNINTVRSTLDRLVATSRARRAGRGLYQAPTG